MPNTKNPNSAIGRLLTILSYYP